MPIHSRWAAMPQPKAGHKTDGLKSALSTHGRKLKIAYIIEDKGFDESYATLG
jgi:hypothetical protein